MSKENIEHQHWIDEITVKLKNLSKEVIAGSKRSYEFLKVRNLVKSDYDKFLTENELKKIDKKLESRQEDVLECFAKYEKLNNPKPKFLPFLLGYLWYNSCDDKNDYLTVVDFSMETGSNRLYLINMKSNKVEVNTTCMQWQWKNWVQTFSNEENTWQTSLGLAQVPVNEKDWNARNYHRERGHKDRNLLLRWAEPWFNDNTWKRYIYIHTWDASKGCFTLPQNEIWHEVVDKMAYGGVIMSFYPDAKYLGETKLLS